MTETIVLIHGLWMTPRSWDNFTYFFEDYGLRVCAPAWPGIEGELAVRHDPSPLAGLGIAEIADHYESFVRSLPEPPILIGHSIGGLIVQLLVARGLGTAAVAINAMPPRDVWRLPWPAIKAAAPVLSNPFNWRRTVELTFDQFRWAFAHVMTEEDAVDAYDDYVIAGPGRIIFEQALSNFNPWARNRVNRFSNYRAPLLLIAGGEDRLAPPAQVKANYSRYRVSEATTDYKEFPRRSHLIIAQDGWEEVAAYALGWAEANKRGAGQVDQTQKKEQAI